jgi:hypothetical protein
MFFLVSLNNFAAVVKLSTPIHWPCITKGRYLDFYDPLSSTSTSIFTSLTLTTSFVLVFSTFAFIYIDSTLEARLLETNPLFPLPITLFLEISIC